MVDSTPVLSQVTLATTNTPAMVRFYNAVLSLDLQPVEAYGTTLYRATAQNVAFVLCPNSLAGVEAEKSRHQFTYAVHNLAATVERSLAAGGVLHEDSHEFERVGNCTVIDPDGNSVVFVQTAASSGNIT